VLRNWRAWVLLVLLVGPVLAYMGFGALWLFEHHWLLLAGSLWFASGIVFAVLGSRWTRAQTPILPPLDWDVPQTFAKIDRDAWTLVENEAELADTIALESLSELDLYINTGRRLAKTLAEHYHPLSTNPIENVAVVDVLTALELAAEDLSQLCRQVPGGDMVTPSHWRKAVQVAGYLQRANDIYSYILPIFSPVTGLVRLGTQQMMSRPAWRNMQQNLLRWFFRAFVNRLGTHLIELYSGRLAIGARQYRRLTRRGAGASAAPEHEVPPLRIAVAGARHSGKSRLIALVDRVRSGDLTLVKARLEADGIDVASLDRLRSALWVEAPGYTQTPGSESTRDRATRDQAVEQAVDADLLILVIDGRRDTAAADAAFARAWDQWYVEHPADSLPPAFVVLTGMDDPALGGQWLPPYDWEKGQGPREAAARAKLNALRTSLPPSLTEIVPVGLPESGPFGVAELLLPTLIAEFHRAERVALLRHLRRVATQSKARRLISQFGQSGRWLWNNVRARGRRGARVS
jgi:hypothetical protein